MSENSWNFNNLLRVFPNMNNTGWVFYTQSGASANVLNYEADDIVKLITQNCEGSYSANGMNHSLLVESVLEKEKVVGWRVSISSFGAADDCVIAVDQIADLISVLVNGPGEIVYECEEHKKISGICIDCLL